MADEIIDRLRQKYKKRGRNATMVSRVTLKATVTTSRDVRERRPLAELELLGQD